MRAAAGRFTDSGGQRIEQFGLIGGLQHQLSKGGRLGGRNPGLLQCGRERGDQLGPALIAVFGAFGHPACEHGIERSWQLRCDIGQRRRRRLHMGDE